MTEQTFGDQDAEYAPADENFREIKPMFRDYPVRRYVVPAPRGVCIDIIASARERPPAERVQAETLAIPKAVVVDGQHFYLPADSTITTRSGGHQVTEVTLTMMARRVRMGYEDELQGPLGRPAGEIELAEDQEQEEEVAGGGDRD
ncbi:hypothetical protein [Streptosporangium sp. NPDC002524]|uniref:hypothetical protein n=1 Tax=Streptosporangium sp. NPDC002524 TaxID=3154537 RepID=UPI00332290A5